MQPPEESIWGMLDGMLLALKCSLILHDHFNDGTFFGDALEVPFCHLGVRSSLGNAWEIHPLY